MSYRDKNPGPRTNKSYKFWLKNGRTDSPGFSERWIQKKQKQSKKIKNMKRKNAKKNEKKQQKSTVVINIKDKNAVFNL